MNATPDRQKIKTVDSNVPVILVVEDEVDNLLLLCHTLIFLRLNFVTATEGQTALALATKYEIDLVLLDLLLPDTNGFEIASLLRQNKSTQNMPIIAVSGLSQEKDRDRAMELGCNDYLLKPYLIEELKAKIYQCLPTAEPWN